MKSQGRRIARLSSVIRCGLVLLGLAILPLSIRSLGADEPIPETPAPASVPAAAKPPAPASLPIPPAPAPPVGIPTTAPTDNPPVLGTNQAPVATVAPNDVNGRLSRLEALVAALAREVRSLNAAHGHPESTSLPAGPSVNRPAAVPSPAPTPEPPTISPDKLPRLHDRLSAPVYYKKQTLVIVTRAGVAAIDFADTFSDGHDSPENTSDEAPNGVVYRYRYLPSTGGREESGEGTVVERYTQGPDGQWSGSGQVNVRAGDVAIEWSRGGKDRGWVYYTPEETAVMIVNSHYDSNTGRGDAVEKLDLRRFRGVPR